MSVPSKYNYLLELKNPWTITKALEEYGTLEVPGKTHNQKIIAWAKEVGGKVEDVYKADEIPWCGLFTAVICQRAEKEVPKDPLWALNWKKFGLPTSEAGLGDILVFQRPGGGHVGFYVGEDKTAYHVLGGNQSDQVCITRILKSRCVAVRRPKYNNQPAEVKPVWLNASGPISKNEA